MDGDIVVPHGDLAVLGTTSVTVDDPDDYPQETWEIERTIEECAAMVPELAAREPVRTYWGVRPLYGPTEAARSSTDTAGADVGDDTGAGTNTGDSRGISRGFELLEHAGVENFASIVGGKLTTHRLMAEVTSDLVCDRLAVDAECETATTSLPGAQDPTVLDGYVREFEAGSPADVDVVGSET